MINTFNLGEDEIKGNFGFIYCITNTTTGKKYIGKKRLMSHTTKKPLKGKVNRRHTRVESDWRTYTGSSNDLNADIALLGHNSFKFDVIEVCKSASVLNYREMELQFQLDVIRATDNQGNKLYYNKVIGTNIRI